MASNQSISLEWLRFSSFAAGAAGSRESYFGAIHSLKPNDTMATAPTPPSQRAANHNRRFASGRDFCSCGINDSRSRV
jgi:hypothetical protein